MTTTELRQELEARVNALNELMTKRAEYGNRYEDAFQTAKEGVDTAVEMVNKSKMQDYFDTWLKGSTPAERVATFIENYRITDNVTVKPNRDKETGVIKSYGLGTGSAMYDILEYVNYGAENNITTVTAKWRLNTNHLNILLHYRIMQDTGATACAKKLEKDAILTWLTADMKKQLEEGKTPLSNTQLVKMLQQVVDLYLLMPKDGDKTGKNSIKVTNYDINYILHSMTKNVDRGKLSIVTEKSLRRFICDIIYRILNKSEYVVESKDIKADED